MAVMLFVRNIPAGFKDATKTLDGHDLAFWTDMFCTPFQPKAGDAKGAELGAEASLNV